jgi:hypothetical protein
MDRSITSTLRLVTLPLAEVTTMNHRLAFHYLSIQN